MGFLFALVLQVAQMLVSGYVTASMQETSETVYDALRAELVIRQAMDDVSDLQNKIAADFEETSAPFSAGIYEVVLDGMSGNLRQFPSSVSESAAQALVRVESARIVVAERLHSLSVVSSTSQRQVFDEALGMLDAALGVLLGALSGAHVVINQIVVAGVSGVEHVRDVPWQAGLIITICGVIIMAAFVAWFSHQLVLPVERAWAQVEARVDERTAQLASTVDALENEIVERKVAEKQKEVLNLQLIEASRAAGMAELANGVLHNVGNVLNSVNVSANMLLDRISHSRANRLSSAVGLLSANGENLVQFLTESPKGRRLPGYLEQLGQHLLDERESLMMEAQDLTACISLLREIVNRQQAYARVSGATSVMKIDDVIDDVLQMHAPLMVQSDVRISRHVVWDQECELDRSRVMQVLMNLIKNAHQAIHLSGKGRGRIDISVVPSGEAHFWIKVSDNGIGVDPAAQCQIFSHGYTTKSEGHGFGLHHSANSASEMGGRLWVQSEGSGCGSTFILELPVNPRQQARPELEVV
jgi:C4-dicarboxylate-specific signal transduction histidine kinase